MTARLRALTGAALGGGPETLRLALGGPSPDVVKLADAFQVLQDARLSADYDDAYDLSRATALGYADTGRDAITRSARLVADDDPDYRLFLRLMIGAVQAKTRRF